MFNNEKIANLTERMEFVETALRRPPLFLEFCASPSRRLIDVSSVLTDVELLRRELAELREALDYEYIVHKRALVKKVPKPDPS